MSNTGYNKMCDFNIGNSFNDNTINVYTNQYNQSFNFKSRNDISNTNESLNDFDMTWKDKIVNLSSFDDATIYKNFGSETTNEHIKSKNIEKSKNKRKNKSKKNVKIPELSMSNPSSKYFDPYRWAEEDIDSEDGLDIKNNRNNLLSLNDIIKSKNELEKCSTAVILGHNKYLEGKYYYCENCPKIFSLPQSYGGHKSRMHKNIISNNNNKNDE